MKNKRGAKTAASWFAKKTLVQVLIFALIILAMFLIVLFVVPALDLGDFGSFILVVSSGIGIFIAGFYVNRSFVSEWKETEPTKKSNKLVKIFLLFIVIMGLVMGIGAFLSENPIETINYLELPFKIIGGLIFLLYIYYRFVRKKS